MEKIANGIWKFRWGEPEKHTPTALREFDILHEALERLSCKGKSPVGPDDINVTITQRGVQIELPLQEGEQVYGFGLQLHRVNHTGRKKMMRVNSDPVADTGDSHAPVPFYVTTSGYGVFVDTSRYATFYCGTNLRKGDSSSKKNERKTVGTSEIELYGYQTTEGNRTVLVDVPSAAGIDVYLFEGPDLLSAVQRYVLFSGGGCLPPLWGLGMWYRAYSAAHKEDVMRLSEGFRKDRMPVDVFGFEPGWQTRAYSCSFLWDEQRFPDHQSMLEQLYGMNYRVNLWEHLFVHPTSPMYDQLLAYSGDYEVWEGLVPDLSVEEARKVFAEHHLETFVNRGISGFKLDECDSSDYVHSNWSFPDAAVFPSGMDGEQMHNQLGILYQSTLLKPFEVSGRRTYSQVRSSGALASPYPFVLYSDLYDHKDFIRGVVNSGFSGLLWTPEVRQANSIEDLIRRIQTVVFSPMALLNCWQIPNPPWLQVEGEKNKAGEFMEDYKWVQEVCRELFEVRMSLVPYLYTAFARYLKEGVPPFRALVMDFPDDEHTYNIDDAYMMGDSILVAPLVTGTREREVYLPRGVWRDFWTHERYEGGRAYTFSPELKRLPVFVKDNTLLPLAKPLQHISDDAEFELTVRIYGSSPEDFLLYEDDGFSLQYRQGDHNWIRLSSLAGGNGRAERSGNFAGSKYTITSWEALG